jgi:large subunit ribosomal protein L5
MMKKMNKMKEIKVEKVTLNVGAGKDQKVLEKGIKLIKNLTGLDPVKTLTQARIQAWGLRPGLPIGCKITLRGEAADTMIKRLVYAVDNTLAEDCYDHNGNISFGIKEYVDIKDAKYDTALGMMGLQASITLKRPGFRVKNRKKQPSKIPLDHRIPRDEAMKFMNEKYGVKTGEKE